MRGEFAISGPFRAEIDLFEEEGYQTWRFDYEGEPLLWRDVVMMWQKNAAFTRFFVALLRGCGYDAYVWETPPLSKANLDQPFECALTQTDLFHERADATPFGETVRPNDPAAPDIVSFANLGGDAVLFAPAYAEGQDYRDLKHFLDAAAEDQILRLWSALGGRLNHTVSDRNLWVSVNGAGVAWLHLRIDDWPKYYLHTPYTRL